MNRLLPFVVIALGASLGAWLRWGLSLWLNSLQSIMPWGTLLANLLGGFLIGALLAYQQSWQLSDLARLLLITGFLGGLTTFSSFSAESLQMIIDQRYIHAIVHTLTHTLGALLCCTLGWLMFK